MSWYYLKYHGEISTLFSYVLFEGASSHMDAARERYYELEEYLSKHEMEFHKAFDVFLFLRTLRAKLDIPAIPYYD